MGSLRRGCPYRAGGEQVVTLDGVLASLEPYPAFSGVSRPCKVFLDLPCPIVKARVHYTGGATIAPVAEPQTKPNRGVEQ